MGHDKLDTFDCPNLSNIDTLMYRGIDSDVLDPFTLLTTIKSNARINVQDIYITITPPDGDMTVEVDGE